MHHALAELERLGQRGAQLGLVLRADDHVGDRQLERVLLEAVEPRPRVELEELAIDAQMRVAARLGPLGEIGVDALARHHQRREQADMLAAVIAQQLRGDALGALRPHRRAVVRAMLQPELDPQQAQEMPDLGGRRDRALAPAARQALLDRHGRRDAVHRIDLGPAGRLHDAARIGVQRFEVAALAFVEQDVEGQRALARAGHAGDDAELAARDGDAQGLQVVLAGVDDADRFVDPWRAARCAFTTHCRGWPSSTRVRPGRGALVLAQRLAGVRARMRLHVLRRAGAHHFAAGLAPFGAEVDDPVGRADHVEVVLDHDQRMPGVEQLAQRAHQLGDVVEVQAGGRLVEQEQRAPSSPAGWRGAAGRLGQEAGQLQPLRLAARQRRHRLAQAHVVEADIDDRLQHARPPRGRRRNSCTASLTVSSSTSATLTAGAAPRMIFTSSSSAR